MAQSTCKESRVSQTAAFYSQLSVFWFALSFLWSGLITMVLQSLVQEMAGPRKDLVLGYTLAAGALVSTLVNLLAGTLSDSTRGRFGRRRPFIFAGTLLALPALWALSFVPGIAALVLVFCAIQFFVNIAAAPYQALVPDLVPREKQGAASAYMGVGSLLGQLLGLLTCGALLAHGGLKALPILMALLSALLLGAMLFTLWRIPDRPVPVDATMPRQSLGATLRWAFALNAREHPDFFWLIASRFVINTGFYTATEFLLYYVTDTLRAPQPAQTVTVLFFITTIAGVCGNFPAGLMADRISKKTIVYVSTAITGVAALVFLLASSLPMAYVAAAIFGVGFGAFAAVDWALATNLLPERDEAKYMGVWNVAFTVPQVIAPMVGGLVAHFVNAQIGAGAGYRAVMFGVLLYLFLGALLVRPIRERTG